MKFNIDKNVFGFYLYTITGFGFKWERFMCDYCEDFFGSKRKLREHIDFLCEESGKHIFWKEESK